MDTLHHVLRDLAREQKRGFESPRSSHRVPRISRSPRPRGKAQERRDLAARGEVEAAAGQEVARHSPLPPRKKRRSPHPEEHRASDASRRMGGPWFETCCYALMATPLTVRPSG